MTFIIAIICNAEVKQLVFCFGNKYPLCEGLWDALNLNVIAVTHCKLSHHFEHIHKTTLWDMGSQELLKSSSSQGFLHRVSRTKTAIYYFSRLKHNFQLHCCIQYGGFTKQSTLKCAMQTIIELMLNWWNEEPANFSHLFLTSFVIYRVIYCFLLVKSISPNFSLIFTMTGFAERVAGYQHFVNVGNHEKHWVTN